MATYTVPNVYFKYENNTLYIRSDSASGYNYVGANSSFLQEFPDGSENYFYTPTWYEKQYPYFIDKKDIKKVVIVNVIHSKTYNDWFAGMTNLETIEGFSNIKVDQTTCLAWMFTNCKLLTTLDVSNWDTSNIKFVEYMFYGCSALTSLDVSNWNTSNVTEMRGMFRECGSLTSLDVSNWDTSNVTDMFLMFYKCSALASLDVSNWDTSKVTRMRQMFRDCSSLTSLDVSDWDTSNVTDMYLMFHGCSTLTSLDVSNFDISNITDMSHMFDGCSALTSLDVSDLDTSNITNMKYIFYGCSSLTSLDISNWNISNVTDISFMFYRCSALTSLDVSNWNTSNVTDMRGMFRECSSLTSLDVSDWDTSNVTNMRVMFFKCSALVSLDVSDWDTSNVTDMYYIFGTCSSLTSLDVSNWDTSNVTDMEYAFFKCSSLTLLDVSNWDTSNVTNMDSTFSNCYALQSLDVSNWDTSNVTTMHYIFDGCSSLTTLDVSNWNTSNVTNMVSMFYRCSALVSLDVSNWNTSNVTTMHSMFRNCSSLTSLDTSNLDTSKVDDITSMFHGCSNLKTSIYINGNPSNIGEAFWDTTKTIVLLGPSNILPQLAATANNNNVHVWSLSDTLKVDRDDETPSSANLSVTVNRFAGNNDSLTDIKVYKEPGTTPMVLTWDDPTITMDSAVKTFNTTLYNLDENKSHSIRVVVEDEYGTADAKLATIPTVFYTIDFLAGGKEISFGAKASRDFLYSQVTGSTAPTFVTDTYYERSVNGLIISYTLLDEEPSDWSTTYSDYYTLKRPNGLFNCEMDADFKGNTNGGIIGEIKMYGGSTTPYGWVFCDGSALSRETYSKLFDVIGTTYGTGDGSTTFNVPDMRARAAIGTNNAALPNGKNASYSQRNRGASGGSETVALNDVKYLPAHTHGEKTLTGYIQFRRYGGSANSGTITTAVGGIVSASSVANQTNYANVAVQSNVSSTNHSRQTINATHTHNSVGSGTAHENMPPFIAVNYMIFTGVFSN